MVDIWTWGYDCIFKDEPDSIDKENDASNDSNKENHFPIKSDAQPGKIWLYMIMIYIMI